MAIFQKKTSPFSKNDQLMSFMENCELTWLEEKLVSGLHPIVKEITENFWLKNCDNSILPDNKMTANQILSYKKKINSVIELLEPCDFFFKNYPPWAKQRKATIEALRNVEKQMKDLVTKCHSIFQARGPKFYYLLLGLLKSSRILSDTEKEILNELKSKCEESSCEALEMCSADLKLLHELGASEYYYKMTNFINDLFGDDISYEILHDLLKLFENLPKQIDNVDNIYTQVRICLRSTLPKISKLLSNGLSISCIILTIFLVAFINRRQYCVILIHFEDLGILNSPEIETAKLIAAARVEASNLKSVISSEMKKQIAFGAMDGGVATVLEIANIVLYTIDVNDAFLTQETELIFEITNKLEKDLISYQKVYEMLEKSTKKRLKMQDITNWTAFIIYHIPTDTNQFEIKSALKPLLGDEAQNCIDLKRLPTNGNNWLVKIPTSHSRLILKEKYIYIAKEQCLVMP